MITRADYDGSSHLGVFCLVNDEFAFVPKPISSELQKIISEKLEVDVIKTTMVQTSLLGIFTVINNKKAITSNILEKAELKVLEDYFSEVIVVDKKYTAIGNLIAMNNKGIASTPILSEVLQAEGLKIADSDLGGSAVYVNDIAFITHRDANSSEIEEMEKIFKVPGGIGTVNFGDPFVKSAIIGNKKGLIVGDATSGPEMNRIDDIFIYE